MFFPEKGKNAYITTISRGYQIMISIDNRAPRVKTQCP